MDDLKQENEKLRAELDDIKKKFRQLEHCRNANIHAPPTEKSKFPGPDSHTTIVVIGGSGDLAKKKTFPSLFALYGLGLLPQNFTIIGYARSHMTDEEFRKQATIHFKGFEDKREAFINRLVYVSGQYGSASDFAKLDQVAAKFEGKLPAHRVYYMAIPPSVFVEVAKAIYASAKSKTGSTRVIVEKPFGRDFQSSEELSTELGALFSEEEVYRIDHYLGKEIVQNLMSLRFANLVWEPLWNKNHIANVVITFKENIGTEGRGGYFDQFGIIRDVMQNHLFQILSLVAMEPPVTLNAEDIRDEKVKVLKSISPLTQQDLVIGQFTKDAEGKNPGYLDDPGVPKDSITPTFAAAVFHINNHRWKGVPFILKCGKGLDERKAEIRIQFKANANNLYPQAARNELVLRVQPNEAVYMKLNAKLPGLSEELVQTELDLSYKSRFDARLPDAYERLIYDVLRGDHNLFVRVDELSAAWKIFTPILHQLEREKIHPETYQFGSRGPATADELLKKYGFERTTGYQWPQTKL